MSPGRKAGTEAENEKEVAELEAQLKEASDTLHELYRRHEENLILLRLPFLEEDETVREQLLAHYEDYFRSQLADFSQSSESEETESSTNESTSDNSDQSTDNTATN